MMARPRLPDALRRASSFRVPIPAKDLELARKDAEARGMSLAGHVRALLRDWRKGRR